MKLPGTNEYKKKMSIEAPSNVSIKYNILFKKYPLNLFPPLLQIEVFHQLNIHPKIIYD